MASAVYILPRLSKEPLETLSRVGVLGAQPTCHLNSRLGSTYADSVIANISEVCNNISVSRLNENFSNKKNMV